LVATLLVVGAAPVLVVGQSESPAARNPADITITTVVKQLGSDWWNRMITGVEQFAADTGVNATVTGPDEPVVEKEIKTIQDLIPLKPDAITTVPVAYDAMEGVLKQAMDAGIIVVTHEAAPQVNTNVDIEAFDNAAYGAAIMDELAACMGGSGTYAGFVGSLTQATHMAWIDGAVARQKEKYPDITMVGDLSESHDDATISYQKAKEVLAKYPDIKGFQGSSSNDTPGIGRAIQEAGLADDTCVVGTALPQAAGKYLADGSIDKIFFWDPAVVGNAMNKLALILIEGGTIEPGLDLGLPGYDNLQPVPGSPHGFYGTGWIVVDKSNWQDYPF